MGKKEENCCDFVDFYEVFIFLNIKEFGFKLLYFFVLESLIS